MTIGIYKGVDADGHPISFFDRGNVQVMEALFEMSDVVADAQLTADLSKVDTMTPVRRVGAVEVVPIEDEALYDLQLADGCADGRKKPVGKPDVGRRPSEAPGSVVIQSLIFDKEKFSPEEARSWIKSHDGFGDYGMEETENSYRFRQYDPEHFARFRTSPLADGIQAVFGVVGALGEDETEDDDDDDDAMEAAKKACDAAVAEAQTGVAIREFNKRISERGLRLVKASAEERPTEEGEERFVMSLVLEPNDGQDGAPMKPDTQDDIYSAEMIRATAHNWMENYGHVDLQHNWEALGKNDVAILESYLAPCTFQLGDYEVVKGTWMLALRIKNETLWQAVKAGEIGAYSVGGTAQRVPIDAETEEQE